MSFDKKIHFYNDYPNEKQTTENFLFTPLLNTQSWFLSTLIDKFANQKIKIIYTGISEEVKKLMKSHVVYKI